MKSEDSFEPTGRVPEKRSSPLPFRAWLNEIWINLDPPHTEESLTPWGVELAYRAFEEDVDLTRFNSIVPTGHRRDVREVASAAAHVVAIEHPDTVPLDQRSDRWGRLCEAILVFESLDAASQDRLLWLLHRLCFHGLVVELSRKSPETGDPDVVASIRTTRAIGQHCLTRYIGSDSYNTIFEALCNATPSGSRAGVEARYHVVIQHAKLSPNAAKAAAAFDDYAQAAELATRRMTTFEAGLVMSRFYRVRAFIPMLQGNMPGMVKDMDVAEKVARSLTPSTEAERLAAAEILWPVLESRVREAQAMGDLLLAERRALDLVAAARLNPRAWLHLGETLLALEKFQEAIPVYVEAHRLGPPASPVALFNLGQCYEMLDQAEPAMDAYAELLQIDPVAIGAAERLASIAGEFGGRYRGWADAIFRDLSKMMNAGV